MKKFITSITLVFFLTSLAGQPKQAFTLSIPDTDSQLFHIEMTCSGLSQEKIEVLMPNWTPGYYQMLNYAKHISNFKVIDETGNTLRWEQTSPNSWLIEKGNAEVVKIFYTSKASIPFVANSLLDSAHGYVMPAGVFLHVRDHLNDPVTLTINNFHKWSDIATGLELTDSVNHAFEAPDFDTFYDSPILLGNLEELESFSIAGIPHRFIGYKLGDFDKRKFMADLRKIVDEAIQIIGDIPYKHYTFLAIGPVPGGIEHLNSTGFGFSSTDFHRRDRLLRMYTFLSHEYFHHYNAKRIRPIELGPFDYYAGSKTTMLWIAEGFTNYYDELIVKRAGLMTNEEYLKSISARIQSFENKPGRLFQTAADASYSTWEDGPFGRTGDDAYKTISVYEKGSLLGFVLDLEIRYYTKNKKSLDDVMRCLYTEYYQHKKRGFTEDEFRIAVEHISGKKMTEFFDYVNTLKPINYQKYLNYAGLKLVENSVELPEPYTGLSFRLRNDTIHVSRVDWQSPAWEAGIRSNDKIFMVNDQHANMESLATAWKSNAPLKLMVVQNRKQQTLTLQPGKKTERQFSIQPYPKPNKLQREILGDWIKTDN